MKKGFLFRLFLQPRAKDKDLARQEFILNLLLWGCIVLATVSVIIVTRNYFGMGEEFVGFPPYVVIFVLLIFLYLYVISRSGYLKSAIYSFIIMLLLPGFLVSIKWGTLVPQVTLIYTLVIVITGILINSRAAFITTFLISVFLIAISFLQVNDLITYDDTWRQEIYSLSDTIAASLTLGVIALVSWLSNREIEKSLERARDSETSLKDERDLLEVKVEERTKELKKTQLEKMSQLYRFADFGRLASGFFHNLVNPLTTVSLSLEKLDDRSKEDLVEMRPLLDQAVRGTKRMESFVRAVKRQIQKQEVDALFNLNQEVTQAIEVLSHKARETEVEIRFIQDKNIQTFGNPLRFNQLMTNLISNAIDAYEETKRQKNRWVVIKLNTKNKNVALTVQDFGSGIPEKDLNTIFDPFFTTKSIDKGTGIGLSICKDIVEKDFGGLISVESEEGVGTTFKVEFPIRETTHDS